MITIPAGYKFSLNSDGTALVAGYQVNVRHVDLLTMAETPWPLNGQGEFYPCGWSGAGPVVFTPTQASPPQTQAYDWELPDTATKAGDPEWAIGHGDLMVYDGEILSTNGAQLWHNGQDITPPEPFSGVAWSGPPFYGYANNNGQFVVRTVIDGTAMYTRPLGAAQVPYSVRNGQPWVSGYSYEFGGAYVVAPTEQKGIIGEMPGPIFEHAGQVFVVTGIMGSDNSPRGVMVRSWANFKADGPGWWCPGIRHQMLQARVRPDGSIVVGGCEFPGSGVITIDVIEAGRPIGPIPPEIPVPPIDPPPPDPEEPVDDAALLAALKNINDKLDAQSAVLLAQSNRLTDLDGDVAAIHTRTLKLEELARAQRDGTVGSLFGTQAMTIRPNLKP